MTGITRISVVVTHQRAFGSPRIRPLAPMLAAVPRLLAQANQLPVPLPVRPAW
jgi:hypothetical protein